jgi:uncharacterized membrane protein YvlD (DUF360 family)
MDRARISAVHLVDVFAYLLVLGVFTQFFPEIISESFLTSLVTAILLKLVLEVVVRVKTGIVGRMKSAETSRARAIAGVCLVAVAAGSKAVILWLTDVILGDAVHLGGFFAVTLLVVVLMVVRTLLRGLIR